jgi:hypothetical protein
VFILYSGCMKLCNLHSMTWSPSTPFFLLLIFICIDDFLIPGRSEIAKWEIPSMQIPGMRYMRNSSWCFVDWLLTSCYLFCTLIPI